MNDFVNQFWNWYVILLVLVSIIACGVLLWTQSAPPAGSRVDTTGHVWDETLEEYNNPLPKWWMWLFYITVIFSLVYAVLYPTLGSFPGLLGWSSSGQWANESWGRYWGWDPKETWALISIMIYAFVIHARFVPALRGKWIYNLMSVVAFYSILMTYFGVNFYLTGMHSYASGDKVVTPSFVYYSVACVAVLGFFSYLSYKKHFKK